MYSFVQIELHSNLCGTVCFLQEVQKKYLTFHILCNGLYYFQMLSRAFRNRFVELHFDEIPANELEIILHKRCDMPLSYCKKMVSVMTDLQVSWITIILPDIL